MTSDSVTCPFCAYKGPSTILHSNVDAFIIEPLGPVSRGHVIVIPYAHVQHAGVNPALTARVMELAASWAHNSYCGAFNIITSAGKAATQTVQHLHIHVVPRREGDGLMLPWSKPA